MKRKVRKLAQRMINGEQLGKREAKCLKEAGVSVKPIREGLTVVVAPKEKK